MRILTALLLTYLVLLTALPCCAFDNCPEDRETADLSCQTNTHQGGDNDGCGTCSPFFSCQHCAGFNLSVKTISFYTKAIEVPPDQVIVFNDRFIPSTYTGKIWQPPKA